MYWTLYRPDAVVVWENPVVRERLRWYYAVMRDVAPAKFHIAARVEAPPDYASFDDERLWRLHEELGKAFDEEWHHQKERPDVSLVRRELPKASFLDVKIELARRQLRRCMLS